MNSAFLENFRFHHVESNAAAGTSNLETDAVDLEGITNNGCVVFSATIGTVAATGHGDLQIEESDTGTGSWSDVGDAAVWGAPTMIKWWWWNCGVRKKGMRVPCSAALRLTPPCWESTQFLVPIVKARLISWTRKLLDIRSTLLTKENGDGCHGCNLGRRGPRDLSSAPR